MIIESWQFRTLAALIAGQSHADGICINLNVAEHLAASGMMRVDALGDCYVTLADLQDVADTYCAALDITAC